MATSASRVTVTSAATLLALDANAGSALIVNRDTVTVYVGGEAVTSAAGYQLDPGESVAVDLFQGEGVYGITASSTAVCHVLRTGA